MGTVNGILTLILMAIFVGIVIWAWRAERRQHFDAAAALPLEEDPREKSHPVSGRPVGSRPVSNRND